MTGVRGGDQGVDCSQIGSVRRDLQGRHAVHDLRHGGISGGDGRRQREGCPANIGHASAAMTLDVYAGLFGDDFDSMADRLDGILADCVPD